MTNMIGQTISHSLTLYNAGVPSKEEEMKQLIQIIIDSKFMVSITMLLVIALGCQQPDASKELKPIADTYVEAWNTGNLDLLDAIIDPQYVRHISPTSTTSAVGLDSLKSIISTFRKTYPDFQVTLDEEIYVGDKSVGRWRYSATNTGQGSFPPTGKKVTTTGISIIQYKNGKMVEEFAETDILAVMQQLGFTLTPPKTDTER
jgi:predicted ester cyclase